MFTENIYTDRLIIRKFKLSDKSGFLSFMLNEDSTKYLNFTDEQKTHSGALAVLEWVISSYDTENPIYSLALESKETGKYIGSIGISPYGKDGEFECYYSINEEYLRQGYAKEAMKGLLDYVFKFGVTKFYAFSHIENAPSEGLALSLGMKFDGIVEREDLPSAAKCFSITPN